MKSILVAILSLSLSQVVFATTKEEVKQKTSEAASAAANYSKEQKDQFQKDMQTKLDDLKAEIAEMKKTASEKTGEAKKEMDQQIAALEKKQDEMSKDMSKLKSSTGRAWGQMKVGVSKAWESLSDSYKKAKAEYTEKK